MREFESRYFYHYLHCFNEFENTLEHLKKNGKVIPDELLTRIVETLKDAEGFCKRVNFDKASSKIALTNVHLKYYKDVQDCSSLLSEVRNASEMVFCDFWERKFIAVPVLLSDFVNNENLFGAQISASFPHAAKEFKDAGNCIAAGCDTASVIHLMRGVEWGLRALCRHLGFSEVRHNKGTISIDFATWDKMLNDAHKKVDAKIDKMRPGNKKQSAQQFYYPLLGDLRGLKDAWRNHVMHTRKTYSGAEALAILEYVKNFMVRLSEKVKE